MELIFVEYVSGYLGLGVNEISREYRKNEEEAHKKAEELRAKNYYGVKVIRATTI